MSKLKYLEGRAMAKNLQRNGRPIVNQIVITTDKGKYFQSYDSIIAFSPADSSSVLLDKNYWDYSKTTSKYRNIFLGLTSEETKQLIKKGEIILTDLN